MKDGDIEPWVALVGVVAKEGNSVLGESAGAFATVMGMASGPRDFRIKVRNFMEKAQFEISEISDAEPLFLRLEFAEMNSEQAFMAKEVQMTGAFQCGTLETYDEEDAD